MDAIDGQMADSAFSGLPPDQQPPAKPARPTAPKRKIPKDFAQRIAGRISTINERELDENVASGDVGALVYKVIDTPEMHRYFYDATHILLGNDDTQKHSATTWTSFLWHEDEHPEYREYLEQLLDHAMNGHRMGDRPHYEHLESGQDFSAYAYLIGESFIQMMKLNSDLYNILTDIYSYIIRVEMSLDLEKKEEDGKKKTIAGRRKAKEQEIVNPKKLYDDIVDYISQRGEFRSDTLNQKNPNEYIIILTDRMRSTRRYVIQDIMNRYALEKKKVLERELKEREASAEEVITAAKPYNHGLYLFWVEKRYNFKYLAVEKVRITLQILAIFLGLGAVGAAFLGLAPLNLLEGLVIGGLMTGFAKLYCSRYVFNPFYPKDVTVDLEKDVGAYTPTFRKMSLMQMNAFLSKQIKAPENGMLLHLMPEYIRYIFAVMPDRNEILLSKDDINEFMERLEVNLSKHQRGR